MNTQIIEWLLKSSIEEFFPTGSYHICNPPVLDTDVDYIVLVRDLSFFGVKKTYDVDENSSMELLDMADEYPNEFISRRFGKINLIITDESSYYDAFVEATKVAKELNLTNKDERIVLFDKIRKQYKSMDQKCKL